MSLPSKETKETYVHEMFNNIATKYDIVNKIMSLGMDNYWRKYAIKLTHITNGGKALDVCCGTGMFVTELAKIVGSSGRVTGLDFSEEMLAIAQKRVYGFKYKNIELIQGNAMQLPFEDNTFDSVTVGWGLRNVPDINKVISEMFRVAKPGAKIVSLDMAKPSTPVFKQVYWLYFEKIVPLMGKIWAGKKSAYTYLHESTLAFPHQKVLTEMFKDAGMINTDYHDLFGGVVATVEGTKPGK